MDNIRAFADALRDNVAQVIVGKADAVDPLIIALLCEGHVLLEDVPGVGKTMLARALSVSMGLDFRRIQCTPDLLPSDITGVNIFNQETRQFQFVAGPAFTHVLLADEINRATPRAQSALLECMGERQVTVDGETRMLPRPFLVLATQNPIEYEGTFPLPEAQLDRFLFKLRLGYVSAAEEGAMLVNLGGRHPIETLGGGGWRQLPAMAEPSGRSASMPRCATTLWRWCKRRAATPTWRWAPAPRLAGALPGGAGPRRDRGPRLVLPDDVQALVPLTLPHRCIVRPESALRGRTADVIVADILANPRSIWEALKSE